MDGNASFAESWLLEDSMMPGTSSRHLQLTAAFMFASQAREESLERRDGAVPRMGGSQN